jgi:flagellar biosynthesis/type III secretory pathway ATPase
MSEGFSLAQYIERVPHIDTTPPYGRVVRTVGLLIESTGPRVSVGSMCHVLGEPGTTPLPVQVVGFRDAIVLSVPLSSRAPARCRLVSARRCSAGSSTRSAGRSTAGRRSGHCRSIRSIRRR